MRAQLEKPEIGDAWADIQTAIARHGQQHPATVFACGVHPPVYNHGCRCQDGKKHCVERRRIQQRKNASLNSGLCSQTKTVRSPALEDVASLMFTSVFPYFPATAHLRYARADSRWGGNEGNSVLVLISTHDSCCAPMQCSFVTVCSYCCRLSLGLWHFLELFFLLLT